MRFGGDWTPQSSSENMTGCLEDAIRPLGPGSPFVDYFLEGLSIGTHGRVTFQIPPRSTRNCQSSPTNDLKDLQYDFP